MTGTGDGPPQSGAEEPDEIGEDERRRRAVLLGAVAAGAVALLIGLGAFLLDSGGDSGSSTPSSTAAPTSQPATTSTSTSTSTVAPTSTTPAPTTSLPDPVADAGADRAVDRGSPVRLEAHGLAEDHADDAVRWVQTSGPDVTGGAGALAGRAVEFDAPLDVSTLVFSLEVDTTGGVSTDEVVVRVFEDVTSAVFVDAQSGAAQADGSMGAPYASIREALELAAGHDVYVRNSGRYDEGEATLELGADVSLYGGFGEGWRRDVNERTAIDLAAVGFSVVGSGERWLSGLDLTVGDAPAGGVSIGVFVDEAEIVHLADSRLVGGMGGAGGGDGEEALTGNLSVGVRAEVTELLSIERSTIHAGAAADGSAPLAPGEGGDVPDPAGDGMTPEGGDGASVDDDGADAAVNERRSGADGGDGGVGAGADGEPGGDSSEADGGTGGTSDDGDESEPGLSGTPGAGGPGGSGGGGGDGGAVPIDGLAGATGSAGVAAQPGGGGAGGGGGAVAPADEPVPQPLPAPTDEVERAGGGGGGGGAGGLPGAAGAGGGGGGGSIGVWVVDVERVVIRESVVAGGRGGSGAPGAPGSVGRAGSDGGNGAVPDADDDSIGVGGGGGGGGAGGGAGGGGGGGGGSSIGLLTAGVEILEVDSSSVRGGAGGAGAAGGVAGADGERGADGSATFGGSAGGSGEAATSAATPGSPAVSGVGAAGGASVGWFDIGTATLVDDDSTFEAGIGGPGGAGSSPGLQGPSIDISN